jgi:hypothetical protein
MQLQAASGSFRNGCGRACTCGGARASTCTRSPPPPCEGRAKEKTWRGAKPSAAAVGKTQSALHGSVHRIVCSVFRRAFAVGTGGRAHLLMDELVRWAYRLEIEPSSYEYFSVAKRTCEQKAPPLEGQRRSHPLALRHNGYRGAEQHKARCTEAQFARCESCHVVKVSGPPADRIAVGVPHQPLLEEVRADRVERRDHHVQTQVELEARDEQRVPNVLLDYVLRGSATASDIEEVGVSGTLQSVGSTPAGRR